MDAARFNRLFPDRAASKAELDFKIWLRKVDLAIMRRAGGLTSSDLPDCCYADWFADGMKPNTAARKAIAKAGGE